MNNPSNPDFSQRPPWWFISILVLLTLPLFFLPWVIARVPDGMDMLRTMLKLSPLYVFAADWLAWVCWWPRRLMSWILTMLIVMSYMVVGIMYFDSIPSAI